MQKYCLHCGAVIQSAAAAEEAPCDKCGRINSPGKNGETVRICPFCNSANPGYAKFCGECGRDMVSEFAGYVKSGVLKPSPFRPRWKISLWSDSGAGFGAPLCPHCGKKVRSDESPRRGGMGYSNPPWNAGWDGICEHCEHHFKLTIDSPLHLNASRNVTVKPANHRIQTFADEALIFSGIEIEVREKPYNDEEKRLSIFLSMGELNEILRSLQNGLRICFEQYDWNDDWT